MTIHCRAVLETALKARLETALKGQGINGMDIPVYSDVPSSIPILHVRLDGFFVVQGSQYSGHTDRHTFLAHIFCSNADSPGDEIINRSTETARVQSLVVGALSEWQPFSGATAITHTSSQDAEDEDPKIEHRFSRFQTHINTETDNG